MIDEGRQLRRLRALAAAQGFQLEQGIWTVGDGGDAAGTAYFIVEELGHETVFLGIDLAERWLSSL
jgi:exo-beta-1,3-glucanase (GH17 family)